MVACIDEGGASWALTFWIITKKRRKGTESGSSHLWSLPAHIWWHTSRLHFLELPKQCHWLGTECSNTLAHAEPFHSDHYILKWSRELVDRFFVGHPLGLGKISMAWANEPSSWPLRALHHGILWAQRVLEAEPRCYRAIKCEHLRWNSLWYPENTELDKELPFLVWTGMGTQDEDLETREGRRDWWIGKDEVQSLKAPNPEKEPSSAEWGSGGPQGELELDIKQKHPLTLASTLTLIWGHQCSKWNNMGTFRA